MCNIAMQSRGSAAAHKELNIVLNRSPSKPIRENQLYKAGSPVGIKALIADLVLSVLLPGEVAPVRPGAVVVGKSVLPGQCPGTEDTSALLFHLRICRQRYHRPANVSRRFRRQEIRVFLSAFLPIGLADSKMLEYRFRTQKPRCQRHRNNVSFAQLAGHGEGQPYDGNLHQVIENVTAVVKGVSICDFENNSSASTQHQRNGVVGSNDVRMDCL